MIYEMKFGMYKIVVYLNHQDLNKKCGNSTKKRISDDENKQTISRKALRTAEKNPENEGKRNMSLTLSNDKNIKKLEGFGINNTEEYMYQYDEVRPRKYSKDGQMKYLVQTLNFMNLFLLLLVMSYMGSGLKILLISWYSSMKPFQNNLNLVIKKRFCS